MAYMAAAADRRSAAADTLAAGHTAAADNSYSVDRLIVVGNLAVMDVHPLMAWAALVGQVDIAVAVH